ncbi:MAG: hypothetical protein H7296_08245 [Bacteroidia bacterium]|nr:hypothetical protein [Bacteroidia bacterium]
MKLILTLTLSILLLHTNGQDLIEKKLEVGKYLTINQCKKGVKEFTAIDIYARTKPYNKKQVNMATGDGLLKTFFDDSSIDAKRLPCVMGGKKYKIAALQEFNDKGINKRVVLCYTTYKLTLIWIELDKALELEEITY